jgi:hypothetical protein
VSTVVAHSTSLPNSSSAHALSIDVPQVSLVNVIGPQTLSLRFLAPLEAGNSIASNTSDSSSWLNYSFIKGGISRPENHIYAKIVNGFVRFGTVLTVYAKPYVGVGLGGLGIPTGLVQLGAIEQRVIQNISSCFTVQALVMDISWFTA